MFGAVLNRLATSVRRALSEYVVLNQEPSLAFDFYNNVYKTNKTTSKFEEAITHVRQGNATMTDGYGPEIVYNGQFTDDITGWSTNGNPSLNNGIVTLPIEDSVSKYIEQTLTTEADKTYIVTASITGGDSTGRVFRVSANNGTTGAFTGSLAAESFSVNTTGNSVELVFRATSSSSTLRLITNSTTNGHYISFDKISVRTMPVIKWAPHNLIDDSDDLNGLGSISGVVRTTTTLTESTTTGPHSTNIGYAPFVGEKYTIAAEVKLEAGTRFVAFRGFGEGGAGKYPIFNLVNGTIEDSGTAFTDVSITDVGDGYYLLKASIVASGTFQWAIHMQISATSGSAGYSYTGDGTSAIAIRKIRQYRSDLGGMVNNPDRSGNDADYVPTTILPIGPNLITNGNFNDGTTGWTGNLGAPLSVVNGALRVTEDGADGSSARAYQTFTTKVGKKYEVKVDYIGGTGAGATYINTSSNFGGAIASVTQMPVGTSTFSFIATATTTFIVLGGGSSPSYNDYDNISIRESAITGSDPRYLPRIGHHVYNGDAWVNEGLLAESELRTNIFDGNDDLDSHAFTQRLTSTANSGISPAGTYDAVEALETASTGEHNFSFGSQFSFVSGTQYTISLYVKPIGDRNIRLGFTSTNFGSQSRTIFKIREKEIVVNNAADSSAIEEVGNGWYRISVTDTATVTGSSGTQAIVQPVDGETLSYLGDVTKGLLLWGLQVEAGATPSSYIHTLESTKSRPAETFTVSAANVPYPEINYLSSELVTNGDFSTNTDWDFSSNPEWEITAGGQLTLTSTTTNFQSATQGQIPVTAGKTYRIAFDIESISSVQTGDVRFRVKAFPSPDAELINDNTLEDATGTNTVEYYVTVPEGKSNLKLEFIGATSRETGDIISIDNVTVREVAKVPELTFAADGIANLYIPSSTTTTFRPIQIRPNSNDYITPFYITASSSISGRINTIFSKAQKLNYVLSPINYLDSEMNTPFSLSSRFSPDDLNFAYKGEIIPESASASPVIGLPDLSSADMEIADTMMGTLRTVRIWDKDLGNTGLIEATNPSLEPSLSLTFEGTGGSSFVVYDWSN